MPVNSRIRSPALRGLLTGVGVAVLFLAKSGPAWALTGDNTLFPLPSFSIHSSSRTYSFLRAQSILHVFSEKVRSLHSYQCVMKNFYRKDKNNPDEWFEISVRYPERKVRISLIYPRKGARLVYRAIARSVRVKPFGFVSLVLTLSPHNSLLVSRFGHTIDHADLRSFLGRILVPACLSKSCVYLGTGSWKGAPVNILNVAPDVVEARRTFGRMILLFDQKRGWLRMVETISPEGKFMERVEYENCEENPVFPPGFFKL